MLCSSGKESRRLPSRISTAHHRNLFVAANCGLDVGSAVVDPDSFKLRKVWQVQSAISAASRYDDGSTPRCPSTIQFDRVRWMAGLQFFGRLSDGDMRAEFLSLYKCTV